ncbi:hypothetical protein IF2G_07496 [Cordyceps javanica]|nr:hypothetical protein IF2G_07496 [Cordyceps javanica]
MYTVLQLDGSACGVSFGWRTWTCAGRATGDQQPPGGGNTARYRRLLQWLQEGPAEVASQASVTGEVGGVAAPAQGQRPTKVPGETLKNYNTGKTRITHATCRGASTGHGPQFPQESTKMLVSAPSTSVTLSVSLRRVLVPGPRKKRHLPRPWAPMPSQAPRGFYRLASSHVLFSFSPS